MQSTKYLSNPKFQRAMVLVPFICLAFAGCDEPTTAVGGGPGCPLEGQFRWTNDECCFEIVDGFQDNDRDGVGTAQAQSRAFCDRVTARDYSPFAGDCNDDCEDCYPETENGPAAEEICDQIDNDCDGNVDEGIPCFDPELCPEDQFPKIPECCVDSQDYFLDADGDGAGTSQMRALGCVESPPEGYAANEADCNDTNRDAFGAHDGEPAKQEVCDNVDNDCDGVIDEEPENCQQQNLCPPNFTFNDGECCRTENLINGQCCEEVKEFFLDADEDGFGTPYLRILDCAGEPPVGYSEYPDDCNDDCFNCRPVADEICDGLDNDCNGQVDDGLMCE